MTLRRAALLAACAVFAGALASAQTPTAERQELLDAQARAEAEAAAARADADAALRRAEAERAEQERIQARIRALGERITVREETLGGAEDRIRAYRRDIAEAEERLHRAQDRMSVLAIALQRIRREPTPAILADPERPRAAGRNLAQIRALMRQLDDARLSARIELDRIAQAEARLADEEDAARDERARLQAEIGELEALLDARRRAETEYTSRARDAEARAAAFAAEAGSLAELAAALATPAAAPARPADGGFAEARLLPPAAGVLRAVRNADGAPSAVILTRPHARVIAPASGAVAFAGVFESHTAVIIEPESGFAIVLTGLGEITVREGEWIEAGQLIGDMPGAVALGGQAREELYIDIYDGARALDPIDWFEDATREVGD